MATATAAIGSCFSATTTPIFHFHSKLASSDSMLRVARIPALLSKPTLTTNVIEQYLVHSTMVVYKHRVLKMSATVAQDEAQVEEAKAVVDEGGEKPEEEERVAEPVEVQNTKLYFGNLPYNCDSALLAGIIQEYASPEMVEVLYDRDTGRSRGFAFVTMSSVEDCEAVIQNLDGSQYGGRTLRVNFSDKPKSREPLYPESEFKLFVGNLSWSVTSESLTEVFQEYGNVVGARVLYDGDTGRSRGYGFVCYSSKQEMDAALESLNGEELEGRDMRISLALGKKNY